MINICAVCFAKADGQPPIERETNPKNENLPPCEVCGDPAKYRNIFAVIGCIFIFYIAFVTLALVVFSLPPIL
jgi:hypothetical protein